MHKDADLFLEDLVSRTRDLLRSAIDSDPLDAYDSPSLRAAFQGCCGLAQCIAGYALQDRGIEVHPIATQSFENYQHGHAALSVAMDDADKKRWFLVDPTFQQFCVSGSDERALTPGEILTQTAEGAQIAAMLVTKGYMEIDAHKASLYFSSFCKGQSPFSSYEEAFAFLQNPAPHPYHFRRDINDDSFSRQNLKARDLVIT